MKQDYKFLKEILLTLEEHSKHLIGTEELVNKLKVDFNDPVKWDNFWGHIFSSSQVETKRAILNIVLANFKLGGQKFSYDFKKTFDWGQSLNKKIPSKKEGVAIGNAYLTVSEMLIASLSIQ